MSLRERWIALESKIVLLFLLWRSQDLNPTEVHEFWKNIYVDVSRRSDTGE